MQILTAELCYAGFASVIAYDPVAGFQAQLLPGDATTRGAELLTEFGLSPGADSTAPAGVELFAQTLSRIVTHPGPPIALIVDFAARMIGRADALSPQEHAAFSRALVLSHRVRARPYGMPPRPYVNTVIWIVDKEGDLPDWFVVGNPRIRHVPVAKPDGGARRSLATSLLSTLAGYRDAQQAEAKQALEAYVDATEGLLLIDLVAIQQLAKSEGVSFSAIGEAVRRYKVGVTEDPWARLPIDKIRDGGEWIRSRVKGQNQAVTHVMDIVKRAVTGVGSPRRGSRPRGVAFFAGPTGVGKTELAKTLTRLLFGDQNAYIRFDMSEFSAEHSDQRLVGAPPGYIGYDVGGELTNAIREKPFSVVLFDEIEKAHPRILDKFLQILDDGVLTSGRGDRVYFSEAFIIFTSNLGIYRQELDGTRSANVSAADPFPQVQVQVRAEIDRYFKATLNRPEILNRIGENILVFDFIRPDVAEEIFDNMLADILEDPGGGDAKAILINDRPKDLLRSLCLTDLSNGGRGIRNKLEVHLVNPLARALFDTQTSQSGTVTIGDIYIDVSGTTSVRLVLSDET